MKKVGPAVALILVLAIFLAPAVSAANSINNAVIRPDTAVENSPVVYELTFNNDGPDVIENVYVEFDPAFLGVIVENETPAGWTFSWNPGENYINYFSTGGTISPGPSPPFKFIAETPNLPGIMRQEYPWVVLGYDVPSEPENGAPGIANTAVTTVEIQAGGSDDNSDIDGDNLYDFLLVTVPVNVTKNGNYRLHASLYDNENVDSRVEIDFKDFNNYFDVGVNLVQFSFDGRKIFKSGENSPYYVEVSVQDENFNFLNRGEYFLETPYFYDNFEIIPVQLVLPITDAALDNDADPENDFIELTVPLKVTVEGTYRFEATLWSNDQMGPNVFPLAFYEIDNYVDENDNSIKLYISGRKVYRTGDNGPYYLQVRIKDSTGADLDDNSYWSSPDYLYDTFDQPTAMIVPGHTSSVTDDDNDNLYDYLIVHAQIQVITPGDYQVRGSLWDTDRTQMIGNAWAAQSFSSSGTYNVNLNFSGSLINQSSRDGPYTIELRLDDPVNNWWDENMNAGQTGAYSFTSFEMATARLSQTYSESLLDQDGDDNYDYLVVEVGVETLEAGTYILEGQLHDNNMGWITWAENKQTLSPENYTIGLYFDGSQIRKSQDNAPYRINIRLNTETWASLGENMYVTENGDYTYDIFTTPAASFKAGQHTEDNENIAGDDFYDYLIVNAALNVRETGMYHINAELTDGSGFKKLAHAWSDNWLDPGDYTVQLKFNGSEIYRSGENTPYKARLFLWGEVGSSFINDQGEYDFTGVYVYSDFERPKAYVEETGHNDYAEDLEPDGTVDYVVVEASIKVNQSGTYAVNANLIDNDWKFYGWAENRLSLNSGSQTVRLRFDGYQIRAMGGIPTRVNINVLDENWKWLGMGEYWLDNAYAPDDFGQPPVSFADNNSYHGDDDDNDGYYDYLTLDVELDVSSAGRYQIFADLFQENDIDPWRREWVGWAESKPTLSSGTQTVTLRFNGAQIYSKGISGPYVAEVRIFTDSWLWMGENRVDIDLTYENFQRPSIKFGTGHQSYVLDTDNNGLYNYVVENVFVDVSQAGKYKIGGVIGKMDMSQPGPPNMFAFTMADVILGVGDNQVVQLYFDTARIYSSGENGPYFVGFPAG